MTLFIYILLYLFRPFHLFLENSLLVTVNNDLDCIHSS